MQPQLLRDSRPPRSSDRGRSTGFKNADATTRNLRYGRVLELLEPGTILGHWSRRSASRIGDAVYYGASPQMLRRMIKRCDTPP